MSSSRSMSILTAGAVSRGCWADEISRSVPRTTSVCVSCGGRRWWPSRSRLCGRARSRADISGPCSSARVPLSTADSLARRASGNGRLGKRSDILLTGIQSKCYSKSWGYRLTTCKDSPSFMFGHIQASDVSGKRSSNDIMFETRLGVHGRHFNPPIMTVSVP